MTVIINELELVAPPDPEPASGLAERGRPSSSAEPTGPTWGDLARALAHQEARLDRIRAH